jgi:pantothenate kinase type III
MRSGLFWGAVGAIRQLIEELARHVDAGATGILPVPSCESVNTIEHGQEAHRTLLQVFLTGGAGATVAKLLGPNAQHIPHLTLAGIALSADD